MYLFDLGFYNRSQIDALQWTFGQIGTYLAYETWIDLIFCCYFNLILRLIWKHAPNKFEKSVENYEHYNYIFQDTEKMKSRLDMQMFDCVDFLVMQYKINSFYTRLSWVSISNICESQIGYKLFHFDIRSNTIQNKFISYKVSNEINWFRLRTLDLRWFYSEWLIHTKRLVVDLRFNRMTKKNVGRKRRHSNYIHQNVKYNIKMMLKVVGR